MKLRYIFFIMIAIILAVLLIYFSPHPNQTPDQTPDDTDTECKAGIIDHLNISQPNETFVETSKNILETAGCKVHYLKGEDVTVDLYRNLPSYDFDLIVFRVHSTGECSADIDDPGWIVFFTSEPYSKTKHVNEQLAGQVVAVRFVEEESDEYFGITPLFVKNSMNGRFNDTVIIMMGCDGLKYTSMAEAFDQRGARVYIGWDGPVMADHTDLATIHLLKHLLLQKQTIVEAMVSTRNEVGPDPASKSKLTFYPISAGPYAIPNLEE